MRTAVRLALRAPQPRACSVAPSPRPGVRLSLRAWCALEQHFALVAPRLAFEHHIVTYRQDKDEAVCLLEGFGVKDKDSRGEDNNKQKQRRESHFPPALLDEAASFELDKAEATEELDLIAIRGAVGSGAAALDATVRARFFTASLLGAILAGKAPEQVDIEGVALRDRMLEELYASSLRKVSIYLGIDREINDSLGQDIGLLLSAKLPRTLADVRVSAGAVPALATGLERRMLEGSLPSLQRVELYRCRLDDDSGMAIGRMLKAPSCRVRLLNLRYVACVGAARVARSAARAWRCARLFPFTCPLAACVPGSSPGSMARPPPCAGPIKWAMWAPRPWARVSSRTPRSPRST